MDPWQIAVVIAFTSAGATVHASVGIGIDAGFAGNLHMRSHLSVPLSDGPRTGAGDPALYLSLTKSW